MNTIGEIHVETEEPDSVDVHVGRRIWQRRRELGLSRRALGEIIGVGLKQVNKYETAANRVSAGRLFEIAQALDVSPHWFFDGLENPGASESDSTDPTGEGAGQRELQSLVGIYHQMPGGVRSKFLRLVRSIADED